MPEVRPVDPAARGRFLRRAGFMLTAIFAVLFCFFVVGETFDDPGGWRAAGLVSAWLVPLAVLAWIGWYRPRWAVRLFPALVAVVIGLSVWFATDPEGWRSFEDRTGPVRAIVSFVLLAAAAVLGLRRTAASGAMLLVAGLVPPVVSGLGSRVGIVSLAVVSVVPVLTGILYLLSASAARRPASPDIGRAEPGERPRAA